MISDELVAAKKGFEAAQAELVALRSQTAEQRGRIEVMEEQLDAGELRVKQAMEEAGEWRSKGSKLESTIQTLEAEKKELEQRLEKERSKFTEDAERLRNMVEAISSGRGRLEAMEALEQERREKEEAWAIERRDFEERIFALNNEIEVLAESNEQLVAALEGASPETLQSVGKSLDKGGDDFLCYRFSLCSFVHVPLFFVLFC